MFECCGVNLLHVGMGGVASLVLGSLWYSSYLFGNSSNCGNNNGCSMTNSMIMEFVNSSVATWALFMVLALLQPANLNEGLYYGFLLNLATTIPGALSDHIWKGISVTNTLVNAGYAVAWTSMVIALRFFLG
ncbi:DUF1761 domain-containing protein [Candidatus Dependentiae bacterium]|nr:DUF1761 domain-containing protein [Candidatus Dependentiae bacterium]